MNGVVYDDGTRRVYAVGNGFVISEGGCWLPGVFADRPAAMAAFDLDDSVLLAVRDRVNASEVDPDRRVITADMLRPET